MSESSDAWRFVDTNEAMTEIVSGRHHFWHTRPDMIPGSNLLVVRCQIPPGGFHHFHHHPHMEEVLYFISGTAEQWVEQNKRMMKQGDSVYISKGIIHATFNAGTDTLEFLAVLSPANNPGPGMIEVGHEEPYKSWRPVKSSP